MFDSNAIFAVLLLLAGIGILTAEVFIPSGGLLGVITFLTLVVSLVFAYRAWGTSHPNIFWSFCGVLLVLVPTAIGTAFYFLPRTSFGKQVLLDGPEIERVTPFAEETAHLHSLVGQFGRAITPLKPTGTISVNGERLQAMSEGMIIESGQTVEVLDVRGTNLVVKSGISPREGPRGPTADESSRLDFEIPQS